jgi:hypothetical protein
MIPFVPTKKPPPLRSSTTSSGSHSGRGGISPPSYQLIFTGGFLPRAANS